MAAIYTAIIEQDKETGLYVGHVPTLAGVRSQGETIEELHHNLKKVLNLIIDDGRDTNCQIISYVIIENE